MRRARSRSAAYQKALMLSAWTSMPSLSMSATRAAATGKPRFPSSCWRAGRSNGVPVTTSSTAGTAACACTSTVRTRRPPMITSRRGAPCATAWRSPHPTPVATAAAWRRNPLRLSMTSSRVSSTHRDRCDSGAGAALDLQRLDDKGELGRACGGKLLEHHILQQINAVLNDHHGVHRQAVAGLGRPQLDTAVVGRDHHRVLGDEPLTGGDANAGVLPAVAGVILAHQLRPAGADDDRV